MGAPYRKYKAVLQNAGAIALSSITDRRAARRALNNPETEDIWGINRGLGVRLRSLFPTTPVVSSRLQ
ncbi:MAG: hypothetical protein DCF19_15560 [Pseudanabaena frigida]|uniref:Uncharacterized protein n=1 Tax=Pseudanabaena frigida TaxID=945775 RepID=A0A2W4W2T3_9CYAN|nr:MAG: hypothetical protein DCF19_15560 [Pseudanabaena frigida]